MSEAEHRVEVLSLKSMNIVFRDYQAISEHYAEDVSARIWLVEVIGFAD